MKKRLIFIALALCLTFSLAMFAGCKSQGDSSGGEVNSPNSPDSPQECVHEFSDWQIITPATCSKVGERSRECSLCDFLETEEIEKLAHTEEVISAVAPTCHSKGSTEGKKCSVCGEILVAPQSVDQTEHNYGDWVIDKEANCTESGSKHKICKNEGCSDRVDEDIPALEHDYVKGVCIRGGCGAIDPNYVSEGLEFTLNEDGLSYSVFKGTCTDAYIAIPAVYNGKPVTSIGVSAFEGCSGLESVTIPNGVTSIDYYAFMDCKGLKSVTIPNSVTSIYSHAFDSCEALTSITIPNSITFVSDSAFLRCDNLQYNKYDNVLYLGNDDNPYVALMKAKDKSITSCTINDKTKIIADNAFSYRKSLTSITIPNSVTSIGNWAFEGCSSLTSATIGNGVTSIGRGAFDNCDSLKYNESDNALYLGNDDNPYVALIKAKDTSITSCTINDKTKVIADIAFEDCSGFTSITIPDSVTSIGDYAFYGCSELTSLTIGNGVTYIDEFAFLDCSELTSLTIGNSVTYISSYAFYGCSSNLESIMVAADNTKYHNKNYCLIETESKTLILGCKNSIIPDDGSVTSIGYGAFNGCSGLTNITIPNGVTSIDDKAFMYCRGLESITIPNSVTSIAEGAFADCNSLTSITVDNSNTKYHSKDNCLIETESKKLILGCKNSIIPDGVTSIGNYAFSGCSGLTSITIPNGVTYIGNYAFSGCSGLTSITIPNGVTSLGIAAFRDCSGLTSITIPNSVTSIGMSAFYYCKGLTEINFSGTVDEWNAIKKDSYWNYNTSATKVVCRDGEVEL